MTLTMMNMNCSSGAYRLPSFWYQKAMFVLVCWFVLIRWDWFVGIFADLLGLVCAGVLVCADLF